MVSPLYLDCFELAKSLSADVKLVFLPSLQARLNVETLEENNVQAVKELARKDGDCKHFKPLLIKARARWPETGFYLVTSHDEGETPEEDGMLKVLQKDFIDSFVNHNFSTSPPTALEQVLHEEGIGPCIEKFYVQLKKKGNMIMYAANINPTEVDPDAPKLLTTANTSMYDMVSYIKYLKGGKHPGIVTPTVYIGSEGAPFGCHREDMSCEAVNRHISGAPNIWFAVPPQYCNAFCNLLSKLGLSLGDRTCANFLQHKHAIVDPRIVVEAGIPVHTIIQKPGDIVYLLPNVIHFGFKLGCSISEAVNICSRTWALPGMLSLPRCHCPS
ncbi:hypothetical protein ONE63_003484 [Megalurothrips usitatus]|uniref:JmjC domain-containing protein n=1 Tax=Megalurothrips usitatus TaxID=439358 RepID=A0AAV7XDG3_9NEOP|nr:hypothetical protein ONE63_003484 [Megalurothrips usitatus]